MLISLVNYKILLEIELKSSRIKLQLPLKMRANRKVYSLSRFY